MGQPGDLHPAMESHLFLPMHAWGNRKINVLVDDCQILTHARMGQPDFLDSTNLICASYPCTHGATMASVINFYLIFSYPCTHGATCVVRDLTLHISFLPMHTWGNLDVPKWDWNRFILTHARMGQPCNPRGTSVI